MTNKNYFKIIQIPIHQSNKVMVCIEPSLIMIYLKHNERNKENSF